jgi:hypothetical protein
LHSGFSSSSFLRDNIGIAGNLVGDLCYTLPFRHRQSAWIHFASSGLTILTLMGIAGLAAALVVETLNTSLGIAIAVCSFLLSVAIACLLVLVREVGVEASVTRLQLPTCPPEAK